MCLVYCRVRTFPGIKVETVSGGEGKSPAVWKAMARQVYCENGRDEYREIGHYSDGAPFLWDEPTRISLTDTAGLLAVATLAPTPGEDLSVVAERTALGIDAERASRIQATSVRERFLSEEELRLAAEKDTERDVLLWTLKEAMLKAVRNTGADIRRDLRLLRIPELLASPRQGNPSSLGEGLAKTSDGREFRLSLFSWKEDSFIVSIAFSEQSARYGTETKR